MFLCSTLRFFHVSVGSLVFGKGLFEDLVIFAWMVEICVNVIEVAIIVIIITSIIFMTVIIIHIIIIQCVWV